MKGRATRAPLRMGLALAAAVACITRHAASSDASSSSAAAPRLPVHVGRSACGSIPAHEIVAVLRVEIGASRVDGAVDGPAHAIAIDCVGERVHVAVTSADAVSRSLDTDLTGAPASVRSRIVALAIAELVRDLDNAPPPPREELAPAAPTALDRDRVTDAQDVRRARATELAAFFQTSQFRLDGAWLVGGGMRFDSTRRHLAVGFDAVVVTAQERFDLGTAATLVAYGSPYVAWRERWGRAEARLGVGYAMGAATLSGRAADSRAVARTVTGPWGAPYALAAAAWTLTDALEVQARGQVGWVILPVVGEVSRTGDVGLEGAWVSVQVGLALLL